MSRTEAPSDPRTEVDEQDRLVETADLTPEDLAALVEQAESDAAEAEQVAAQARARVNRLQSENDSGTSRFGRWRVRLGKPRRTRVAMVVALLCTGALLTASGFMITQDRAVQAEDRNRAEFVAAARQMAVTLMSIDFNNPQDSVQRIVDNSVDPFLQEFEGSAEDFIKVAKDAKVITKATANAAAVESMTADSAVVLVAVSSTVTNADAAAEAPRHWRLNVDLQRDGDQIKMSKVEFVS